MKQERQRSRMREVIYINYIFVKKSCNKIQLVNRGFLTKVT